MVICIRTTTLLALAVASVPLKADPVADFYKGKDLTIIVGSGPSGGYDTYSRALSRHLGKYMPGNPSVVVQNMPGAGGAVMMNHLANRANPDGTVIGSAFGQSLIEPVLDRGKFTKYDSRKLSWIANISGQVSACFTLNSVSKIRTLEDARKSEVLMSSTNAASPSTIGANILNMLAGAKFKVISGYSTPESTLAIERGEVEGMCIAYETLVTRHPDWTSGPVSNHKVSWLAVISDEEAPNLPGVPPATNFIQSEEDKDIIRILRRQLVMGRPYVAPEGVPQNRLKAIREAFFATMNDPVFRAEAARLEMIIDPSDHLAMEKLVADTYAMPARIIDRAVDLIEKAKLGEIQVAK
ncbi:MAG: efflux transporter protein [Acidimicrobiales bacterium]|nr:efflux transporter protein [Acidimicrobiales bacterium]